MEEAGENLGSAQSVIQSSIESARANINWTQRFSDDIRGWFTRGGADKARINLSVLLTVVLGLKLFLL